MHATDLHAAVTGWYDDNRRDLPWRRQGTSAWAVLVSEVMLQQTPVSRVEPAYRQWLARWPTAESLAAASAGDAIRQWGRLGYPRRGLRLHQTAVAITARPDGEVPTTYDELLALPGVGAYTAAAVAVFAHHQRHAVLDTNVRRVLGRLLRAEATPTAHLTAAERSAATALLPADPARAAHWSVAVMELGALVCTARRPACESCPVARWCAWKDTEQLRRPAAPPVRRQGYAGTDRQCRGAILGHLRSSAAPVPPAAAAADWPDVEQRRRALESLVTDGLAVRTPDGLLSLP